MKRFLDSPVYAQITDYRPDIDGVRALAVLSVIFYHFGFAGFTGGYVGVDVFFVISGYLITRILIKDNGKPGSALLRFWERRARRILPALFFMLAVVTAVTLVFYLPLELRRYGVELASQAVFSSNILYFFKNGGYFDAAAETQTLLHTWSLSVEEQFYVLYPLVFLALIRAGRKALLIGVTLISVVSLGISISTIHRYAEANFFLLPFRAWELGLGCTLALLAAPAVSRRASEVFSTVGLALVLGTVLLFDHATAFPGYAALVPCIGTGLLILFADRSPVCGGMLRAPWLVGIGRLSYSLYLWHWPLLVFYSTVSVSEPGLPASALLMGMTFLLAWFSWRFIETPFRTRAVFPLRKPLLAFSAVFAALLFAAGLVVRAENGFPGRWNVDVVMLEQGERDRNRSSGTCRGHNAETVEHGMFCELGRNSHYLPKQILVWGDSHGGAVLPVLQSLSEQRNVPGWYSTRPACKPLVSDTYSQRQGCEEFVTSVIDFLETEPEIEHLVLVFRWASFKGDLQLYIAELKETLEKTRNGNRKIWFVRQVPEYSWPVPRKLARTAASSESFDNLGLSYSHFVSQRANKDAVIVGLSDLIDGVIDPGEALCRAKTGCINVKDGKSLYTDEHHLSVSGAMVLEDLFAQTLFNSL